MNRVSLNVSTVVLQQSILQLQQKGGQTQCGHTGKATCQEETDWHNASSPLPNSGQLKVYKLVIFRTIYCFTNRITA